MGSVEPDFGALGELSSKLQAAEWLGDLLEDETKTRHLEGEG